MEIKGKVIDVSEISNISDKLKKRELILEYAENAQYPEYIKFECINDKCKLLDTLRVGNDVEIHFNLKGRPWTDKKGVKSYFNSLQLWKVSALGPNNTPPEYAPEQDASDLPF